MLGRCTDDDLAEAEAAIERLAIAPADGALAVRDVWLLRLRALLALARGDLTGYRDLLEIYRDTAKTLGFEGHTAWAESCLTIHGLNGLTANCSTR